MSIDRLIEKWKAHYLSVGTTPDDRQRAIRGYRSYYEECELPWIGDDNVHFFLSPMAAVRAISNAFLRDEKDRTYSDAEIEAKANELWASRMLGRMDPSNTAIAEHKAIGGRFREVDQAQCSCWWPTDAGVWASDNPIAVFATDDRYAGPDLEWADGWRVSTPHGDLLDQELRSGLEELVNNTNLEKGNN